MYENRIRPLEEILDMLKEAAELPGYFEIGEEEARILWAEIQRLQRAARSK